MNLPQANVGAYKKQSLFGGWTRVEMLLQLYDRGIASITSAQAAEQEDDPDAYARSFIDAQKVILAIHTGLKPDEHEIAFNIARLLHFVLTCLESHDFDSALKVMSELRNGFVAICDEANQLEHQGAIPAMETKDVYHATA